MASINIIICYVLDDLLDVLQGAGLELLDGFLVRAIGFQRFHNSFHIR